MDKSNKKTVHDYWKFMRELRAQLNAVQSMGCMFFELEDLCNYAIRNEITVIDDNGERISVVDDCLAEEQLGWYRKLRKVVKDLDIMLADGESCFKK